MRRITKRFTKPADENGFAALIIGIVLVIVLSLLTVGYSQLVRNEEGQTLNKQLSTQAFYAAESGINDALDYLHHNPLSSIDSCQNPPLSAAYNPVIDQAHDVSYTCVLIDSSPPTLPYSDLGSDVKAQDFSAVKNSATQQVGYINISWECTNANGGCPKSSFQAQSPPYQLTPDGTWSGVLGKGATDALEFKLTGLDPNGTLNLNRSSLMSTTDAMILYPAKGGGTPNSVAFSGAAADQGAIYSGQCSTASAEPNACNVQIDVRSLHATTFSFTLRGLYGSGTDVQMSLLAPDGITPLNFGGGVPPLIDVTGKAQNVLKRIQVRVPLNADGNYAPAAIQAGEGVCKRIEPYPGNPGGTDVFTADILAQGATGATDLCSLNTTSVQEDAAVGSSLCSPNCAPGGGSNPKPGPKPCVPASNSCYKTSITLHNLSNNSSNVMVTGCKWDFGDGTPAIVLAGSDPACQYGGAESHTYSLAAMSGLQPYPGSCNKYHYTVTLTMIFNDGSKSASKDETLPNC